MYKRIRIGCASFAALLVLILDSPTAIKAVQEGIHMCAKSVIPALFPFFFLSVLLTGNMQGISVRALLPVAKLMGLPDGAESLLIPGFLGGYPTGAQAVAQLAREGALSKVDAQRMLPFLNNPGPSFLFGIMAQIFAKKQHAWVLWAIIFLSALLVSLLFPAKDKKTIPVCGKETSMQQALERSLHILARVCGWIILTKILIAFLNNWILIFLPETVKVCLFSLIEIANGCYSLSALKSEFLKGLFSSVFLSAGGMCVSLQTMSVAEGLSLKPYFLGKAIQSIAAGGLWAAYWLFGPSALAGTMLLFVLIRVSEKYISVDYGTHDKRIGMKG